MSSRQERKKDRIIAQGQRSAALGRQKKNQQCAEGAPQQSRFAAKRRKRRKALAKIAGGALPGVVEIPAGE